MTTTAATTQQTGETLRHDRVEVDPADFRRFLVPIDGGPLSVDAVTQALALAARTGAELVFLTVTEPFEPGASYAVTLHKTHEAHQRSARVHAEQILAPALAAAEAAEIGARSLHVEDDEPYRAIIRAAGDNLCDLIVMASHGRRGVAAVLLGSQTVKVLTHSAIPVLVCRRKADGRPHN